MASVENKVVSITFNSSNFDKKVASTIKSLDALNKTLAFPNAGKGMADLTKAAGSFNMGGMSEAVGGVSKKFIALSTIAITALSNITTKAIAAGTEFAKSFTITPITDGFAEYELKMGAIQTIMAGSGESLSTVNGYLEELNLYADRTIFSFADMTQNIGKFTNAGVSLEDSVAAIQGVANVSALSGANAQQASNAMYNFAQALAAGSVKLIDWKSIENAGLATIGFKDSLLEGAVAAGTLTKDAAGLYSTLDGVPVDNMKNFNLTLQEGWLDAETLTTTLGKYSDETTDVGKQAAAAAQDVKTLSQALDTIKEAAGSGWAQSSEIVFGDFEEGKALWTEFEGAISGVIGTSADMRNQVLSDWKELGGRTLLIDGIRDAISGLGTIITPIREAFRDIFPRKTGQDLYALTERFAAFAKAIAISGGTADKIKRIFKGVFAILSIGVAVVKGVVSVFTGLFKTFAAGSSGGILTFFAKIGDGVVALKEGLVDGGGIVDFFTKLTKSIAGFISGINLQPTIDALKNFFNFLELAYNLLFKGDFVGGLGWFEDDPIVGTLLSIREAIIGVIDAAKNLFGGGVSAGAEGAKSTWGAIKNIFEALWGVVKSIGNALVSLGQKFGVIGEFAGDFVGALKDELVNIGGALGDVLTSGSFDNVLKAVSVGLFGGLVAIIAKFLKGGIELDFGGGFMEKASDALKQVTKNMKAMQHNVQADTLLKIAYALGVLTAAIFVLSLIDGGDLAKALGALAVGLAELGVAMAGLQKISGGPKDSANLILMAVGLTVLAGAMFLLGLSAKLLSTMDWDEMALGIAGVTALLLGMAKAVDMMKANNDGMIQAAAGLILMAIALLIMAAAVKLMSMIHWSDMLLGMGGVAVSLGLMVTALNKMPTSGMIQAAFSIGILALALMLMAIAIDRMQKLGLINMGEGLIGIAGALTIIVVAMRNMKGTEKAGLSLLALAAALRTLAEVVKIFGTMPIAQLAQGMTAMGLMLLGLVWILHGFESSIGGAFAVIIVAGALLLLSKAFEAFNGVGILNIIYGLGALAGVMLVMAVAGYLMAPIIPVLIGLGVALFLIGAAVALAGVGMLAFARALQIVAKLGGAAIEAFLKFIDAIIEKLPDMAKAAGLAVGEFMKAWVSSWPELLKMIGGLIRQLLDLIIEFIPKLVEIAILFVEGLLETIVTLYPQISEAGYEVLISFLSGLRDNIGEIVTLTSEIIIEFLEALAAKANDMVTAGFDLLIAFVSGITENIGELQNAVAELVIAFIEGFGEAYVAITAAGAQMIADIITGIVDSVDLIITAGANAIISFLEGIASNVLLVVDAGFQIVIDLLNGLADSIRENRGELAKAGLNILSAVFGGITGFATSTLWPWFSALVGTVISKIGKVFTSLGYLGKNLISGFYNGTIGKAAEILWPWFSGILGKIKDLIGTGYTALKYIGKNLVIGLWNGISSLGGWLYEKVSDFIKDKVMRPWSLIPGVNSPSTVLHEIGAWLVVGLGEGIDSKARYIERMTTDSATGVVDAFKETLSKIPTELEGMEEFNPVITPVLDLSHVQRDAKGLNGLMVNGTVAAGGYSQANYINHTHDVNQNGVDDHAESGPTEVTFEQNIYSPTALSTNDIYRATRSQITTAKEELSIV